VAPAPYTRELQRMGVQLLYGDIDVGKELKLIGPRLRVAILCRPHAASRWLDTVREFAPSAKVAYDTVDLHWVREARRHLSRTGGTALVGINGAIDPEFIPPKAKALRELELALIRATDATFTVTADERIQVERDVPGANVLVIPTVHEVAPYVASAEERSGILFVGSFEHPPNVDAAVFLAKEVMPAVWRELGDVTLTIAGADPPREVEALASHTVDVTGWVPDLHRLLEMARMLAAPVLYGAGLKGKITQALAAGLPVVTTSLGAEGLGDGCVLVTNSARDMSLEVVRLHRDGELWQRLSEAGQRFIAENCSTDLVSRQLGEFLSDATAPPQATEMAQSR